MAQALVCIVYALVIHLMLLHYRLAIASRAVPCRALANNNY